MHSIYHKYCIFFFLSFYSINFIYSQDVEPRRWSSLPLEFKFIGAGYGFTSGDIFFDPVLEAEDATIEVNSLLATYIQPFKIGSRLARIDVRIPVGFVHYEGLLNGEPATLNRSGFLDPRVRISVNLVGPPALNLKELQQYFGEHPVNSTFGLSLGITVPIGQYFEEKLINLGENRFVFRPQFGLLHNWRSWSYELTGSIYLFTNNNNFFEDGLRKQDPIYTLQTHLIKRFPSRFWGSLSLAIGHGGESIVNHVPKKDNRTDLIGALSVGFPLVKGQNLKIVYLHAEALADSGADTDSFILGWSIQIN